MRKVCECASCLLSPQSRQSAKPFLQSRELGLLQVGSNHTPSGKCASPPPPLARRGAHWLPRKGVGESQFRRGDIQCGTLYLYVLCVWACLGDTEPSSKIKMYCILLFPHFSPFLESGLSEKIKIKHVKTYSGGCSNKDLAMVYLSNLAGKFL